VKRALVVLAVVALLGGQYVWYRTSARVWAGPEDGPHIVRVGLERDHAPFSSLDADGRLVGFEPDLARELCRRMQVRCVLVPQPWKGMFHELMGGKYDIAITSTPIAKILTGNVIFSDKIYSLAGRLACCGSDPAGVRVGDGERKLPWRFVMRRGKEPDFNRLDLDVRVGIVRWGNFGELLEETWPDTDLVPFDTLSQAIAALEAGKVDMLLADEATLDKSLLATPEGKDFVLAGPTIQGPGMLGEDAGIAVRREEGDLLAPLNAALRSMRADGSYRKLSERYFGTDIYGGRG